MNLKRYLAVSVSILGTITLASPDAATAADRNVSGTDRHLLAKRFKVRIEHEVVQADDLMLKGKYTEAEDLYKTVLQKNTKSVPAQVGYGMALAKQFKLEAARAQFDKILTQDPKNAMAHAGLAMVMYNSLQSSNQSVRSNRDAILKNAEAECKQGLMIDPGMPEAHYTLGNIYKAQGRMDEAASEFKEATKLDPMYSEAFTGSGLISMLKGDYADASASFKQAITLNSGNSTAHYGLGRTFFKQGQFDDALKELNISLYQHPNSAPVKLTQGEVYAAQGNTVGAIGAFQEAIRIKPETPEAYLNIADIREQRGDLEHAIAQLRSGVEMMPDNAALQQRIGDLSLRAEKLDDSIKAYSKVLEVQPGDGPSAQGLTRAYYLKANKDATSAFFVSNEFEQSKAMIDKAVAMNPNNMELRLAQMKMRAMMGDPVDLKAVAPPTTDGERVAYAEALLAQNKYAEADQQLQTVIGNASSAKEAFAVADLALMIKDLKNADAAYKKAATFPGDDTRKRADRGAAAVAKAQDTARQDLTLADDLARKKQRASAIDKYHAAIYGNPRVANSHFGLAATLEQLKPTTSKDLREAIVQYKAYITLRPDLPEKELKKLNKKIASLEERAYKLEQKEKGTG